jgi:hypothetical protein
MLCQWSRLSRYEFLFSFVIVFLLVQINFAKRAHELFTIFMITIHVFRRNCRCLRKPWGGFEPIR